MVAMERCPQHLEFEPANLSSLTRTRKPVQEQNQGLTERERDMIDTGCHGEMSRGGRGRGRGRGGEGEGEGERGRGGGRGGGGEGEREGAIIAKFHVSCIAIGE